MTTSPVTIALQAKTIQSGALAVRSLTVGALLSAFLLSVCCATSHAQGSFEPNDDIAAATPVGAEPVSASLESSSDDDWYRIELAPRRQVTVAVTFSTPSGTSNTCGENFDGGRFTVRDEQSERLSDERGTSTYSLTTPAEASRIYVDVYARNGCAYTLQISPSDAVLPPVAEPPHVPAGEPDESLAQATGPLDGDVYYEGMIDTSNDLEYLYFYAGGSRKVTLDFLSPGGCTDTRAFRGTVFEDGTQDANPDDRLPGGVNGNVYLDLYLRRIVTFAARPAVARYNIAIEGGQGCRWLVKVSPATALSRSLDATLPKASSPECKAARRQRARYARLVTQAKRTLRRTHSGHRRASARRSLSARRKLLRSAKRAVARTCQ